ncbi:MAG: ABC transporter ATP-binding protein [Streptococcaceae bacterium]|nr:ABC transporter ATP-binding protein [Streptococcaceae bacterium]
MIKIENFYKQFGEKRLFNDFSLEVKKGEFIALMGPSGSGKTTLLNAIGLIEPIERGNYEILSKQAPKINTNSAMKMIRENISYLFQNFALVDYLTVEENLMMALKYTKLSKIQKREKIENALHSVGLPGHEKIKVFELSGGEQQRIAIARVIIKPGDIILADEPTGALDAKNRDEILSILLKLNQKGKTIIIVTHDLVVAKHCHRIIELAN